MKFSILLPAMLVLASSTAFAQSSEVEDIQSQIAQQQQQLDKLKADMQAASGELDRVQDDIKSSDYKMTTLNEKIEDLCGQLKENGEDLANNPACSN